MCANFGFGCKIFVRRDIKSNVFDELEVRNNMDTAKTETNEDAHHISKHKPLNVDAPPKGKFVYIIVF